MAKVHSILDLSGTLSNITFVDSRAYGTHGRAKRGTYTPITMSEGMKLSSLDLAQANLRAKIIFDAVSQFAPGFKDGKFWSKLLSIFRKQKKEGKSFNYADFSNMELRQDYSTTKQGQFSITNVEKSIKLTYNVSVDKGYCFSILRIAADETLLIPYPIEISEFHIKDGKKTGTTQFDFTPLPANAQILYILKCERLENGEISGLLKGKSVKFFCTKQQLNRNAASMYGRFGK